MKRIAFMLLALPMLPMAVAYAEPAFIARDTGLMEQSQSDAAQIASLTAGDKVDVLRRVGAWSEIKAADGKTGWVRMTALKFGTDSASAPAKHGGLGALGELLSAGRTSNSATVTTGVRGLTDEDLQNAQANPAELDKAKKFAVDAQAAKKFASSSKLSANKVEYLSQPDTNSRSEEK